MVAGLSHLQTHGVSRQVLVPPGVSPIGDPSSQGGSDILYSVFCILYSVFCILYSVFCFLFSVFSLSVCVVFVPFRAVL